MSLLWQSKISFVNFSLILDFHYKIIHITCIFNYWSRVISGERIYKHANTCAYVNTCIQAKKKKKPFLKGLFGKEGFYVKWHLICMVSYVILFMCHLVIFIC